MRELRATLSVLRDSDDASAATGLDDLPGLLDRVCAAGLSAALTVNGERRAMPTEVDRTVYRIVQEALTNVSRHSGAASAMVEITYRPHAVGVRVDDNGQARPGTPLTPGIGLIGMRERVTALGGRLRTGPRDEGGFTVQADFPLSKRHAVMAPASHASPRAMSDRMV
jgi:signal transduction histidine kinase